MKKAEKTALFFILVVLVFLISINFDYQIVGEVSKIRTALLTDFFLGITFASSSIIMFFFLTSLFLLREQKRRWILPLWLTLACSFIISFILKVLIQRPRPFEVGLDAIMQGLESTLAHLNYSFPSFQTMLVFSALPILSKEFRKFKYIWIVFACLIAFSRVYYGIHFASDVITGAVLGYLIGSFIVKLELEYSFGEKSTRLIKKKK